MHKNMRVFIAYCVFFNPGREMATGFTNITTVFTCAGCNSCYIGETSRYSPTENFLTALNYQSTYGNSKTATSFSQLNGLSSQELAPTIIQVNDVTYA